MFLGNKTFIVGGRHDDNAPWIEWLGVLLRSWYGLPSSFGRHLR
jgi:hypothetical protein